MAEQLNPSARVNRVVPGSAQATIARLGAGTFGPGAQVMADYLFDTVTLATGAQSLDFFSVPLGGAKTVADTNLSLPGQLPRGQAFEVHYINARLLRGSVVASTAAQAAFADLLAGSFWRHFFPGSDFWLRHAGAEFLPRTSLSYEIAAGDISSNFMFVNELGISIKEIPQVIGEQVSFGLNVAIPAGIAAALNGAKLQVSYRTNLVKRT